MGKIDINLHTVIQRKEEILASNLDGEKVMMSIEKGEYYGLGKTGTFIWDNIEESIKIADLIKLIIEKYNVDENQCFEDIVPFIKDLIEKELIVATY
ncbi:MAG: lasso peptide biosynthesis PqqD family chaperone [Bacteroidales bacterium]|nr:lasso peptide biosynthesis PqqD family chaperone [Bacteroidales bacterium]